MIVGRQLRDDVEDAINEAGEVMDDGGEVEEAALMEETVVGSAVASEDVEVTLFAPTTFIVRSSTSIPVPATCLLIGVEVAGQLTISEIVGERSFGSAL